jgi:hypothetical protein
MLHKDILSTGTGIYTGMKNLCHFVFPIRDLKRL